MFRKQAYCFFIIDFIGRIEIEFIFDGLIQALLEWKTIRINPIPIFLSKYKIEANKSLEFFGEVYAFREAKDG